MTKNILIWVAAALIVTGVCVYWFGIRPHQIVKKCNNSAQTKIQTEEATKVDQEIIDTSTADIGLGNGYINSLKELKNQGKIQEAFLKISSVTAQGHSETEKSAKNIVNCITGHGLSCNSITDAYNLKIKELNQDYINKQTLSYYYDCLKQNGIR